MTLLDNCFDNHIKNQHEKLLNGADIHGLHFQGDDETIKDTPLINILAGEVYLPVSVQNIVDCTGHITGDYKKDDKFVADSLFDPINDLDTENKLVDPYMFDEASVCRKAQNILKVFYPILSCIVGAEHTCHNVFKGWAYIEEITKLCREDKVCLISVKTEIRGITISKFPFIITPHLFVPPYNGSLPPLGNIHDL